MKIGGVRREQGAMIVEMVREAIEDKRERKRLRAVVVHGNAMVRSRKNVVIAQRRELDKKKENKKIN